MSVVKRLYFYVVAFVSLMVAANGAALLLRYLFDTVAGSRLAGEGSDILSFGIAMTLVGAPLWLLHWGFAQRQVRLHAEETGAVLRKLYIYGVMFVAATVAFFVARSVLTDLMQAQSVSNTSLAHLVVWAGVWAFHVAIERGEGQPLPGSRTVRRWYMYVVSAYSLLFLVQALATVLSVLMTTAYEGLFQGAVMGGRQELWSPQMQGAVASALVAVTWWAWHWTVLARGDAQSTLRRVYLFLFAFLFGVLTAVIAAAQMVYVVFAWALGVPDLPALSVHFERVPMLLPTLLVGLAMLGYHWGVVQDEGGMRRAGDLSMAGRAYQYIMAAVGLGTLATGTAILIGTLLGVALPEETLASDGETWRRTMALALTLLVIGAPLWFWYWGRVQRTVETTGTDERRALPRRIFIYGTLGVLALAGLGTLTGFLATTLQALLDGKAFLPTIRDARWLLATAVTTAGFFAYYAQVLREDQRAGAEQEVQGKSVTVAVGENARELAEHLRVALGPRTSVLWVAMAEGATPAPVPTDEEVAAIVQRVRDAPTKRVLVTATDGSVQVLPIR